MRGLALFAAACATAVLAKPEKAKPRGALLTIEVAPGETRQITEEERYETASVGQ